MGLWDQAINTMATDPNNPDVFYFGTGEFLRNAAEEIIAIYKVSDEWQTGSPLKSWENWNVCGWSQVNKIVVDPDSSNWMYAAGINSGYCSSFGAVLLSQDGGDTWIDKKIGTSSSDQVSNIAVTKNSLGEKTIFAIYGFIYLQNLDIVYIGKERAGQVFKVQEAWGNQVATAITPDEGIENVQDIIVDNQSNLFVATEDGLWRRDGEGWVKLNCLADNITVLAVDNSRNPSVVYAGSEGDGIFVSDDSGESWMVFNT